MSIGRRGTASASAYAKAAAEAFGAISWSATAVGSGPVSDGALVAADDAPEVGASDGANVGTADAASDGVSVGKPVGAVVGASLRARD